MLKPVYTKRFEKDLKKMLKRGKNKSKIKMILQKLITQEKLNDKYRDHLLIGNYKNRRECHIEPDWILIYKLETKKVVFERTGTHSDLFR